MYAFLVNSVISMIICIEIDLLFKKSILKQLIMESKLKKQKIEKFDIMVDIETLSTEPNAVILTVSAVKFNMKDDKNLDTFYYRIDRESCEKLGMHVDENTIKWWKNQKEEVRLEAFEEKNRFGIKFVLMKLAEFVRDANCLWSHSPNFDYVILESAYKKCSINVPWKFWQLRDTRTVYDLADVNLKEFSKPTESHNALYDCFNQIKALKQSYKNLKL